jgi:hypothetical protein
VISFLYCMAAIFYYVFMETSLTVDDRPPVLNSADLVFSLLNTFFWLCAAASLAWAKGQLATILSPQNIVQEHGINVICNDGNMNCKSSEPSFVKLNSSVAFGFLNIFLWGAGLWFVWKESPFFARVDPPQQTQATPSA